MQPHWALGQRYPGIGLGVLAEWCKLGQVPSLNVPLCIQGQLLLRDTPAPSPPPTLKESTIDGWQEMLVS